MYMQIPIINPIFQTILFGVVILTIFAATFCKKQNYTSFSLTQELKGFAILTILFGHIGYFLSVNRDFLFPFSVMSGVGVNLFLFLSGYGVTSSEIKGGKGILQFYKKRLLKLFVPFWIVLTLLLIFSSVFLAKLYSGAFILQSFLGIFTSADIFTDINSPFWYFSFILFYYLLFPLLFNRKRTWITALFLLALGWVIITLNPAYFSGVIGLYQIHFIAFPLGVAMAWFINSKKVLLNLIKQNYTKYSAYLYPVSIIVLLLSTAYFAINSGIGVSANTEQAISLVSMGLIVLLFLIKKRESKLFSLFGLYSYEIYLFHWPLIYYYDFIYRYIPAWIATIFYLAIFIALAILLKKVSGKVTKALTIVEN